MQIRKRLAKLWAAGLLDHITVEHPFNEKVRDCKIMFEVSLYGILFHVFYSTNSVRYTQDVV